ncbi:MAG: amino acid ABC transporter ATP-binding protein [Actinomycetota bacterium]
MATDGTIVRLSGLDKHFGRLHVLKEVSLSIRGGEVVVLFGRSGSGKSTLLRCINFLEEPTGGTIEVDGIRLDVGPNLRARREQIRQIRMRTGMVFQEFNLFPHLTALENVIEGPVTVQQRSRAECIPLAEELLAKVGLAEKRDEHPIRLSGGQKQRVAIARALAMQPKIMLFDEPTSALDPELIGGVLEVIKDLAHEGMTMMVVTHEMGFARDVADRMIFMHEGRLVEEGTPAQLFAGARDENTRRFLEAIR